jgi:hypothetical protein
MDRARQREIASQGGKAAHEQGKAHQWTKEDAAKAGRIGGAAPRRQTPIRQRGVIRERLWRVRKDSRWIEAHVLVHESENPLGSGVELQMFRDNRLLYARRWPTRAHAVVEADNKLRELQLAGWATHW